MTDLPVEYKKYRQTAADASPWTKREQVRMLAWDLCWAGLCRWTPKPLNRWRLVWLKGFGCRIFGRPFVHQHAIIRKPWNLTLHDKACLGDGANAYTLGEIEIGERATIAQEAYLCTGTHDFSDGIIPLMTAKITVEADAFIGARAFVMPGVTIREGAVIGAASVVTKEMPAWTICAGNPCKPIKPRNVPSKP